MKWFVKGTMMPGLLLSVSLCAGLRAQADTIAGVAAKAGHFKTLLGLVKSAGLSEALTGKEEMTVFAPTDAAFARVPKKMLEYLSKPENKEKLAALLKYHIIKGKITASNVLRLPSPTSIDSLAGSKLVITHSGRSVFLNGKSQVVKTDILADNGVIHSIDTVLIPPAPQSGKMQKSRS